MCLVYVTVSSGQPEDRKDYVAAKNTVQICTTRFPFEAGSFPRKMDMAAAEATIVFHEEKYCHTFQGWTTPRKLHSVNDISPCDHLKIPSTFSPELCLSHNYAPMIPLIILVTNEDWWEKCQILQLVPLTREREILKEF